ncbi:hypothetical protein [Spirillospora sp. NPDC047279]|uniref:hypothetical protein n=1 Tax=Spirillospora sp. NPDC047279 TaxID=3155478 RepID=UPI0033D90BDA
MPNSPSAHPRHGPNTFTSPTAADIAGSPSATADMLADALVRHMFALSMELHRVLGCISPPNGSTGRSWPDSYPAAHPNSSTAGNGSLHLHPESEGLRQILWQTIADLDEMVRQTRTLVFAHRGGTSPAAAGRR